MRGWWLTPVVAVLVAAMGCAEQTSPSASRPLVLELTAPEVDGALAIIITGPGVGAAAATTSSYTVYSHAASDGELRLLLFGNIGTGPLVRIELDDPRQASAYAVRITEVARLDNTLQTDLARYRVAVTGGAP